VLSVRYVANFSLATSECFTDRNGAKEERTDWHRIVAFGRLADTCERFLTKGRQVYIEGGSLPASTKRRTATASATEPKSWRTNSACSAIAPTRPRPRRQITPSSSRHITGGARKRLSPNHFNHNRLMLETTHSSRRSGDAGDVQRKFESAGARRKGQLRARFLVRCDFRVAAPEVARYAQ
jgi:single-stranded DNA-binding protein